MDQQQNPEEFYESLREKLEESTDWPSEYLYKFIVESSNEKIVEIENLFDGMGAVISTKPSRNGKYTSLSINVRMKDPNAVIAKYKEVGEKVKGIISL